MVALTEVPVEVQLHIFAEAEPSDLGKLATVCKSFNNLIRGNALLYKQIYLTYWDDPAEHPTRPEIDWEQSVHQAVSARKIADCKNVELQRGALPDFAKAVTLLSSTATPSTSSSRPRNVIYLDRLINNWTNPDAQRNLLCQSALFGRAYGHVIHHSIAAQARKQQLASAKMHCLYGVPIQHPDEFVDMYPYAASKVYDLRNYRTENRWGPFMDDGSDLVDWEKLEAIMLVLGYNISRIDTDPESSLARLWRTPFVGTAPGSYRPVGVPARDDYIAVSPALWDRAPWCRTSPDPELEAQDPYGISGTWLRIVCFLDYRDLYDYNFGTNAQPRLRSEPRQPLNTDEAVRLIIMTLVVTGIHYPEEPETDVNPSPSTPSSTSNPPASASPYSYSSNKPAAPSTSMPPYRRAPIVSFTGTARALHSAWDPNANSTIRGTVMTTPEGEIRWTSVSVYAGDEERWKGEGIQVGGIKSARGVLGTWFDKNYAPQGPAGPTAFWKIRDEVCAGSEEERRERERRDREREAAAVGIAPLVVTFAADDDDDEDDGDGDQAMEL